MSQALSTITGLPDWLRRRQPYPTAPDELGDEPQTPPQSTQIAPLMPQRDAMDTGGLPADLIPAPLTVPDQRGRPVIGPGASRDPLMAQKQLRTNVEDYEPQKGNWKERYLIPIVMGALGGGRYGGAGALGGAIGGAISGGLDPTRTDRNWKTQHLGKTNQAIEGIQGEQDQAQVRELRQAQIEKAQREPQEKILPAPVSKRVLTKEEYGLPAGTTIERKFNPKTNVFEDSIDTNGEAIVVGAAPKDRASSAPPSHVVGGALYERGPDGEWQVKVQAPEKPERGAETPKQFADRQNEFNSAVSEYQGLIAQENAAAKLKADAEDRLAQIHPDDEEGLKRAREDARKAGEHYASFWEKKNGAIAKIKKSGGDVDAQGNPVAPKPVQIAPKTQAGAEPSPSTHGFKIHLWLAQNPGKTEADARAFHDSSPKYKVYPIEP